MAQAANKQIRSSKALEIAMRDVMDSLEESVCVYAYHPVSDCMEILSIEAPAIVTDEIPHNPHLSAAKSQVHSIAHREQTDIVSYLIQREEQLEKLSA